MYDWRVTDTDNLRAARAELVEERARCRTTDMGNLSRRIAELDDMIADGNDADQH